MSPRKTVTPKVRCAIYTRKSTDEGLDMEFNSLDAQRESCEAYIASQKSEGWFLVPDRYDDGGFSGANLERPALKRLLEQVEAGLVNVVVVYKIDRLTRSLLDFAKLVETFDRHEVTFASVTQSFNTTTSMGRLTLNVLLSFAQFEREIAAERIRDKIAASKRKGIWMGGHVPIGYIVRDRKLEVVPEEAELIRFIFKRYLETGSALTIVEELDLAGAVARSGKPFDKGYIYRILGNRHYLGEIPMGEQSFPGEHDALVDQESWNKAQALLASNNRQRVRRRRRKSLALLCGIIYCRHCDRSMSPTYVRKRGKEYRYYLCQAASKNGHKTCAICSVAANEIESVVVQQVRTVLRSPEVVVKTWRAGRRAGTEIQERDVTEALQRLDPVWDELFPAEQQRLIQLLVAKVDVFPDAVKVHLRAEGLNTLARELNDLWNQKKEKAA
ncbi:MAG: recombinase family protein [Magnetococcales bacterium]|nr:recombinase family protein [Magnetococcales bacterium]